MQDLRPQKKRRSLVEMLTHLQSFSLDLKFSAGLWFFSPPASRFHAPYRPAVPIEKRLEMAARLQPYGLAAIEAHYPSEIDDHNVELYQKFVRDTGIRLITVIPNLFYPERFEFGSLSSPIEAARRHAIDVTRRALELNVAFETEFAVVWPGIDGYDHPFGVDYVGLRDRFADGLAEAMDAVPGVRVAIEPKPYEPRARILYATTAEGILACQAVEARLQSPANRAVLERGDCMVGMNPEIGHILMAFEDVPNALSLVLEHGRLAHTHWNSQPLGNYDQDLNVGVVSPEQAEAALYTLKMYGYQGYFGIDVNPERMPVERALINSMDALRAMNERIDRLDHAKVLESHAHPDRNRGYLEAMLTRARAPQGARLSPMPDWEAVR